MKHQDQNQKTKSPITTIILTCLLIIYTFLLHGQTQIGQAINGEANGDGLGHSVSLSSNGSVMAVGVHLNDENGLESGKVKIYENVNGTWTQIGQDLLGEFMLDQSGFNISLSANGNIVAIGAPGNDGNGTDSGHVRVYEYLNNNWVQLGQDINGETPFDESGWKVSLSSNGQTLAITAPFNSVNGANTGHITVYQLQNGTWTQLGQDIYGSPLIPLLGISLSLSENGNILAVGTPAVGQVLVYELVNGVWVQLAQTLDDGISSGFGHSLSLSSDGTILAVGATSSNKVEIFEIVDNSWMQLGQSINGEASGDQSGFSVSMSSNGKIIAIGSIRNNNFVGHVRVYEYQNNTWVQLGVDIEGQNVNDEFGFSISLSANGDKLAIGAPLNDSNGLDSGQVRIYDLTALLSINSNTLSEVKLFPNPTTTSFTIVLNETIHLKSVSLYNQLGQLVLNTTNSVITTDKLKSGIYMVKIISDNGTTTKQLIIN